MRLPLILACVLTLTGLSATATYAQCVEDRVELRGDWGSARFRVAIADEPRERSQGLMRVEDMPRLSGMLFIYERPQRVSFWMENTLIPLDMIFMTEQGLVRRVHSNAVPLDRTPIPGGSDDILYVLEVNGGVAADFGITEGSQMRHLTIPDDIALWPCGE